jgi:cytochrome c556
LRLRYLAPVLCAAALSCHAPKRDYDAKQIAAVGNIKELMDVQATVADPRFKLARKLKGKEITDAQFAEFVDMGSRLGATSKRLEYFSKGAGFDKYAKTLGTQAAELEKAARGRNGPATTDTALAIKNTCAACHGEYK